MITFFSRSLSHNFTILFNPHSLVILDNLENLFKTEELAGQYLSKYEDYRQFFEQIVTKNY